MRSALCPFALAVVLLSGGAASAREVKEFKGQPTTTTASKKPKGGGEDVNRWNGDDNIPVEKELPWGFIILSGIILAIAAPFGIRMYRNTSAEVEETNSVGKRSSRQEDEA
ncbi:MAG: hypothetical protein RL653_2557 [Pseudomonadota bacterium]|jgi:hypothetical protein